MSMKGNNAQIYPYSVFMLKSEMQINVRQGEKCFPNTKWQKTFSSSLDNLPID